LVCAHIDRIAADRQRELRTAMALGAGEHDWADDEIDQLLEFSQTEWRAARERAIEQLEYELDRLTVSASNLLH
jgi:hypothetical protein